MPCLQLWKEGTSTETVLHGRHRISAGCEAFVSIGVQEFADINLRILGALFEHDRNILSSVRHLFSGYFSQTCELSLAKVKERSNEL